MEFWGKWVQGAIASYRYNHDPELYEIIKKSAEDMMATQTEDGYIGNYPPKYQLNGWDVWGRKYTALGLICWYDLSKDKKALDSACRLIDHLMTQVGPGKVDIVSTGFYIGMASSSVLEPVLYLYNKTKEEKYLNFARYIVDRWEKKGGPALISKSLNDVPVANRFPHPKAWFSPENGHKAYEMMSCYEGLLELYKITKNPLYLTVVEKTVNHIINEEINIAGSGSAFECWYDGKRLQTLPTYHTMETCVTFTWMQLCNRLLELTGNTLYADCMERTIYNALMASLKDDGSQIVKYSPLEGCRYEGEEQCGMHINCCNANGPRAFAMIPQAIYRSEENRIKVNFFMTSEADFIVNKKVNVHLAQITDYPKTDKIEFEINPSKASEFTMSLRIPFWSEQLCVKVNDEELKDVEKGCYLNIKRQWKKGDRISLQFDLRARLLEMNNAQAILRGPVVMARDSRFNDGFVDEASNIVGENGFVELTPVDNPPFSWMAFQVKSVLGTGLEGSDAAKMIHVCDFSSAGNNWDPAHRYRVWLPKTLNVMHMPYKSYNR